MADEEKRSEDEAIAEGSAAAESAPADGAATDAALVQAGADAGAGAEDSAAAEDSEKVPATTKSSEVESIVGQVAARSADTTGTGVHPLAGDPPSSTEGVHDHHGHGHVAPMMMLFGVLGALIILTVMTVAVTSVDLGSQGNFVVAMVIATVKAALVMGYFMHLVWDSKFNVVVFLSSFLFVILFLGMALLDRQEYQKSIDDFATTQALTAE